MRLLLTGVVIVLLAACGGPGAGPGGASSPANAPAGGGSPVARPGAPQPGAPQPGARQSGSTPVASRGALVIADDLDDVEDGDEASEGLRMLLSEGGGQPPERVERPVADAQALSPGRVTALLARLPPLPDDADGEADFAFPATSRPPPRPGRTIEEVFPPDADGPPPAHVIVRPLGVRRRAPEGEVDTAPALSLAFDRPMVPLGGTATAGAVDDPGALPVRLEPQPAGDWRWLDTATLLFEPEGGRFPRATRYLATVPIGTASLDGARLDAPVTWAFATPPPSLTSRWPNGGISDLRPTVLVGFDQRIDADAVLAHLDLRASGREVAVRRLDLDELRARARDADAAAAEAGGTASGGASPGDAARAAAALARHRSEVAAGVLRVAEMLPAGTWVACEPVADLPADTEIAAILPSGLPSAEGPRTTDAEQRFGFKTRGPLEIVGTECGGRRGDCRPGRPFEIEFSNALDVASLTEGTVSVSPPVESLHVWTAGPLLMVLGDTAANTTYEVTIGGALGDVFGQTLGEPERRSFDVGEAARPYPAAWIGGGHYVVLDPWGGPVFPVHTRNYERLDLALYAVQPEDFADFVAADAFWRALDAGKTATPPGEKVWSARLDLSDRPDEIVETLIDLRPAFGDDDLGHAILIATPDDPSPRPKNWRARTEVRWLSRTDLAVDALADPDELQAWVTSLRDGSPRAGVAVTLDGGGATVVTDERGLARFPLPAADPGRAEGPSFLVAADGEDRALLPARTYWATWRTPSTWVRRPTTDSLLWFVFDDRHLYRPGETVHVKGWLRVMEGRKGGDLRGFGHAGATLAWQAADARGHSLGEGEATLSPYGGFDVTLTVPPGTDLGTARVELSVASGRPISDPVQEFGGTSFTHWFQVQEFRRPEYEVSVIADAGPHLVGGAAELTAQARYFAGGGLSGAPVTWLVRASPGDFVPPGWDRFVFGEWRPWWGFRDWEFGRGPSSGSYETLASTTNAAGDHDLRIEFLEARPARPFAVHVEAAVTDVNRQRWADSADLLVHAADEYVGLRAEKTFVRAGERFALELIVADLDGAAVAGREVDLSAWRDAWVTRDGQWVQERADLREWTVTSGAEPVPFDVEAGDGGRWTLQAVVHDDAERANRTRLSLWASGAGTPPARDLEQERVELIPDGESYQAGDTAHLLVQAPFSSGHGLMRVQRSGTLTTEVFEVRDGSATLSIPIAEEHVPNLVVEVDVAGNAPRVDDAGELILDGPPRPAYAHGEITLSVPPLRRTLSVEVVPRDDELQPGGETVVDVVVRDADGEPVRGGEVAVVVVDEAILALAGYAIADPVAAFYLQRGDESIETWLRSFVQLAAHARDLAEGYGRGAQDGFGKVGQRLMTHPGGSAAPGPGPPMAALAEMGYVAESAAYDDDIESLVDDAGGKAPVRERSNFDPLALFAARVALGDDGRAAVPVTLPDNLTRYRVTAVAVDDAKRFGKGESTITARLPLMLRPSPPRFLNWGDRFELPVVLQNGTDDVLHVELAARAANARVGVGAAGGGADGGVARGAGWSVDVPARDRVEVRVPTTTSRPGTARFQLVAAVAGGAAGSSAASATDAASFTLPVWTPATTEAFAVYGEIDEGAIEQRVSAPPGAIAGFGGLELTTSSTALAGLTDAFLYLQTYPFACAEQVASRVLSVAALRDVLAAFAAEGLPAPEEIERAMTADIARLAAMQNHDGGWGFWRGGTESVPYLSVHVALALTTARAHGFAVPDPVLERAKDYLFDIGKRLPSWYGREARLSIEAFALDVWRRTGDPAPAAARALVDRAGGIDELPLEALGWLLPTLASEAGPTPLVAAGLRRLGNVASETAGAAHFTTDYSEDGWVLLHSDRRTDAVLLDALLAVAPKDPLVPKVVAGLLSHRVAGRWGNTQENAFVLLALRRYFDAFESVDPDFVARAWLGPRLAAEQPFAGRSADRRHVAVPLSALAGTPSSPEPLVIDKQGTGRLYYRLGLRYAPSDLQLDALDRGFAVSRAYEAIDDPADVTRDADGTWRVRLGATVRVRVQMVAPSVRSHVALVDPLPAGLESLNPALAMTGELPPDKDDAARPWWHWPWYEHTNLRDDRAEAFRSRLDAGVYTYDYVARATTPGVFVVPPPRAEEMYAPETFGRGGSDVVVVD